MIMVFLTIMNMENPFVLATICGGVTIGDGSVIGAGSVVTKDIPAGVLAAGNPCKVMREITEKDSMYIKAKRV